MATTITSECINCGACEPECPNTAIYAGGVPWELNGTPGAAIAQDIYYIVPSKCTECVGFHDHEACAAVCPVDCCIPDPANLESEGVLLARARELHPETTFPDDAPSRFRKEGRRTCARRRRRGSGHQWRGSRGQACCRSCSGTKASGSCRGRARSCAPVAAAGLAMMHLPKDIGALPGPVGEKHFPGELDADFDTVLASVDASPVRTAPAPVQVAFRLGEPVLGAMPDGVKANLEHAVGTTAGFSRQRSTALNMIFNLILYPALLTAFAVAVLGDRLFSQSTGGWIMLGVLIAAAEAAWRLREGVIHAKPASDLTYRGCWYGLALAPLGSILVSAGGKGRPTERKVAFDGFEGTMHEDKTERDRRYGTVYTVAEYVECVPGAARDAASAAAVLAQATVESARRDARLRLQHRARRQCDYDQRECARRDDPPAFLRLVVVPGRLHDANRVRQAGRCVQASDARQSARGHRFQGGRGAVSECRLKNLRS